MTNDPDAQVGALLAAWRADIDSEPRRNPTPVDDALEIIASAREAGKPARRCVRRLHARLAKRRIE